MGIITANRSYQFTVDWHIGIVIGFYDKTFHGAVCDFSGHLIVCFVLKTIQSCEDFFVDE